MKPVKGPLRRVVMGQPALSVDGAVATLLPLAWRRSHARDSLWPWLIETLIRVLPIDVNAWDRFSIRQRHFIHDPASTPERFGGSSHARIS